MINSIKQWFINLFDYQEYYVEQHENGNEQRKAAIISIVKQHSEARQQEQKDSRRSNL